MTFAKKSFFYLSLGTAKYIQHQLFKGDHHLGLIHQSIYIIFSSYNIAPMHYPRGKARPPHA